MTAESAEPDCRCPEPNRPTGREPEQLPPWKCLTCGGFACDYAERGQTRCPSWRCDCFIATHPDSPMDLHPEVFVVGVVTPPAPAPEVATKTSDMQALGNRVHDLLAEVICYEKHHQREPQGACPNCRSRAVAIHAPYVIPALLAVVTPPELGDA